MSRRTLIIILSCMLIVIGAALAIWRLNYSSNPSDGPNLMPAPYLRLLEIHEEPFGHGWGVDLPGFGPTLKYESVQAHTLKPNGSQHSDMHQIFRAGRIEFLDDGAGRCLEAKKSESGSHLDANNCSNSQKQKWEEEGGQLRLAGSQLCLTVGEQDTQRPAGPFVRRDLLLEKCQRHDGQLWSWVT